MPFAILRQTKGMRPIRDSCRKDAKERCGREDVMHRIGIISDTHGLLRPEVAEGLRGCERILHGGDISSAEILEALQGIAPTFAVRGNNDKDWARVLPETLSMELYGVRFFMVHNKKHLPRDTEGMDVIIYGHSHKYEEKRSGGLLFLNPGSCGPRRFTQPITFAILEIGEDGSLRVEKREIAHQTKCAEGSVSKRHIGEASGHGRAGGSRRQGRDNGSGMKKIVQAVMRDTDKGICVEEIAARQGIDKELAEQICRLYVTHPGVSVDGILGKMGL